MKFPAKEFLNSFRRCREITRREAKHFYFGFRLLPKPERWAMFAVYSFMRRADDLADAAEGNNADAIQDWRLALSDAYRGAADSDPILPAFCETVRHFNLPKSHFEELIRGVEMDLEKNRYETFNELYRYCYLVGCTPGFAMLDVVGAQAEKVRPYAESLGIAFQLTNILRDVREDAEMGRIYLPQEDLRRFGCSDVELIDAEASPQFREFMEFQWQRADSFYLKAEPLFAMIPAKGRTAITAMARIYRGLLNKIRKKNYDVLSARVRLSLPEKLALVAGGAYGK